MEFLVAVLVVLVCIGLGIFIVKQIPIEPAWLKAVCIALVAFIGLIVLVTILVSGHVPFTGWSYPGRHW